MMAGAVKMLAVSGIGAGKPRLGRLKKTLLCGTISDWSNGSCKRKPFPQLRIYLFRNDF
jgi:hypothetical protein